MPIVFSLHALQQLRRRKISQKAIKEVIKSSQEFLSSYKGRKLRRMSQNGKIIEVVTKTEGPKITIITAYYLEK